MSDARPGADGSPGACERPLNLIAELTYRCPLRCPYCSNPVDLGIAREALEASDWGRVFRQAAELGVVHVGLTGGEPTARTDLAELIAAAEAADLYTHLVTSGLPVRAAGIEALARAGLRSVQLSIQDAQAEGSDWIAGTRSFDEKIAFARETRRLGLPLVLNVVLHRHNLDRTPEIIELARELDCERLELANVQFHGWARRNRDALMPTRAQVEAAAQVATRARQEHARPEIVFVLPDHFRARPKPCMGGWGRKNLVVAPDGRVLPCQEAHTIPGLEFWKVGERSLVECWEEAPGMRAFRGDSWMEDPCRSCPERQTDFGGCRCQAYHLVGRASATDPACELAPERAAFVDGVAGASERAAAAEDTHFDYRRA